MMHPLVSKQRDTSECFSLRAIVCTFPSHRLFRSGGGDALPGAEVDRERLALMSSLDFLRQKLTLVMGHASQAMPGEQSGRNTGSKEILWGDRYSLGTVPQWCYVLLPGHVRNNLGKYTE